MLFGALEAGGTKMVCAIGSEEGEILERASIPTRTPDETMPKLAEFFTGKGIAALGIGCFGPIDLNRTSETYGYITTTPKLPWKNYDICGYFRERLHVPVGFDTDVNGSMPGAVPGDWIPPSTSPSAPVSESESWLTASFSTACCTRKGDTSSCPSVLTILMRENAPTTRPVWKVLPQALP